MITPHFLGNEKFVKGCLWVYLSFKHYIAKGQ